MSTIHSSPMHFLPPAAVGIIGQVLTCADSLGATAWETVASQNFNFTGVQFVAIGGNDLNDGLTLDTPKATIQAAINAGSDGFLIWVLDAGQYNENLTFPYGCQLYAPNAELNGTGSGDILTVTNTGPKVIRMTIGDVNQGGPGLGLNIIGADTVVFLDATIFFGSITCEGSLIVNDVAQVLSTIHILSTGQLVMSITADVGCT